MELRDYLRIMRRRWLLIVGCVVIAIGAAAGITYAMTPMYASTAQLFVSTSGGSDTGEAYQGSLFSAQRVTSYAQLVDGDALARDVIQAEGLGIEPTELSEQVSASVVPETVLLDVTVEDADPEMARRLAAAYSEQLVQKVDELESPNGRRSAPITASVVDEASFSDVPVSPQPLRNLGLAGVLGLLLGLGLAVLRELLDTTLKGGGDVEEVTGASVMADIAFDSRASKQPLVTSLDSHAPRVEAFRVLRTNMQFVDVDQQSKVFVVTSSIPGEGKTTTATNLAITLAQTGQSVLMIDGDLRRPQLAGLLDLEPAVGLTTVLIGSIDWQDALQETSVPNLTLLTSGRVPPNPSELLQSQAMYDVLQHARKEYDVIIVDSPPLLPVTDAALLAAQADGALVVVRHSKTTKDQVRHSMERLEAVGAKALGVVFNMVPNKGGRTKGYGYGYGYGYAPEKQARGARRKA